MPTFGYPPSAQSTARAGLDRVGLRDHGLVPILAQIPLCVCPWSRSRPLSLRLPSGFVRPRISPRLAVRVEMRVAPSETEVTLSPHGMY